MKNAKHNVQTNVNAGMKGLTGIIWPGSQEVLKPKPQNLITTSALIRHQDIVSSLPLQILLSNHWLVDVAFGLFSTGSLYYKFKFIPEQANLKRWQVITTLSGLIVWIITEIGRIYLGFAGNLLEQVPHLAGFFFLSVFPQLPILLWMVFLQEPIYEIDRILCVIQLIILIMEIIFGYWANRRIISAQTLRWRIEMRRREEASETTPLILDEDIIRDTPKHVRSRSPHITRIHPGEEPLKPDGKRTKVGASDQGLGASISNRTNVGASRLESKRSDSINLTGSSNRKLSMMDVVSSVGRGRSTNTFLSRLKEQRKRNSPEANPSGMLSFNEKLRRRKQALKKSKAEESSLQPEIEMKKKS